METFYPVIPDLDKMSLEQAYELIEETADLVPAYKIHSLADRALESTIRECKKRGAQKIFVDYKLDDMPDTVAGRAREIKDAGADILTVHAEGRPEMIAAAIEHGPKIILAVTKLTSWTDQDIEKFYRRPAIDVITELAMWALEGGAPGIVCSGKHVGKLSKNEALKDMIKLIPGIRSNGVPTYDQKDPSTPYMAMLNGGTHLVGGRQISKASNRREAFIAMGEEGLQGLKDRAKDATA